MNIYLVRRKSTHNWDYSSFVVVCGSEYEAVNTHPNGSKIDWDCPNTDASGWEWVKDKKDIKVKLLGVARAGIEKGVECASYHGM